ncbi:MAG: hypothetical protein FWC38_02080 [Proteobacteria bacterium]|nr:hypothetical protein [Pseudomonadota bacterium]MCL2307029.1 hypothetical protein [Pseudomonadota bacterium]
MLTIFRSAVLAPVAALALLLTPPAHAAEFIDYTDIWADVKAPANEAGFGINFVQSGNSFDFIFATFFIYDPATGNPDWVTAQLEREKGKTSFTGNIYRVQGAPTDSPFVPRNTVTNALGTATFTPASSATGTLLYTVGDVTTTLELKRLTLTENILDGKYWGMAAIRSSNCSSSINNGTFYEIIHLNVAKQAGSTQVTYTFIMEEGHICTMRGTLIQEGRFQKINNASYVCHLGSNKVVDGTANLSDIAATTQGIEGKWTSNKGLGNCREGVRFSGVLLP